VTQILGQVQRLFAGQQSRFAPMSLPHGGMQGEDLHPQVDRPRGQELHRGRHLRHGQTGDGRFGPGFVGRGRQTRAWPNSYKG
jgi:hypothetical protein